MDKKYCQGCYNDIYNHASDNPSGVSTCWLLKTAKVEMRKEVHVDQVPPWNQKARRFASCYRRPRFVYVAALRVR